jgi:hypothetical protein
MAEAGRKSQSFSEAAEGWIDTAQEVARGAAQKATDGSAYVQDQLNAMDDNVRHYTGKPLGGWTEDLRAFVSQHPLTGAALIIGVGLAAAKLMRR